MARGVNKVILVGNLGNDPEVRYTTSGTAIASLSIATSESWTDKQSGEKQERTEWHRVKMFGRLAEIAGEYLKKGRQVYIEGSLRTEKYTDKQGVEKYSTDVIANEMQMLGGGDSDGAGQRGGQRDDARGGDNGGGERGHSQGNRGNGNGQANRGNGNGNGGGNRNHGSGNGNQGNQSRGNGSGYQRTPPQGGHSGGYGDGPAEDDIPFASRSFRSLVL